LWKLFHQYHVFRYQCSEHSTDTEIQAVYEQAKRRQGMFDNIVHVHSLDRAVVFLDEGGLADQKRNALKVIHYHLDHPRVGTVICTNKMLDAAKSNRAMIVAREDSSVSDESELVTLARGIFKLPENQDQIYSYGRQEDLSNVLSALCSAFRAAKMLPAVIESGVLFQRRDFIHFMRHLYKRSTSSSGADHTAVITGPGLLDAIERNLGGLPPAAQREVVDLFFDRANKQLSPGRQMEKPALLTPALHLIQRSLYVQQDTVN